MQLITTPTRVTTEYVVPIADFAVRGGNATLVTIGLGSCVGIVLYSASAGIGALAHAMLPKPASSSVDVAPGKFVSTAVPIMVQRMRALGALHDIEARLVGGASMFAALLQPSAISLGAQNVAAAHVACTAHNIRVVAHDVGGAHGRSVYFSVVTGAVLVRSVQMGDVHL